MRSHTLAGPAFCKRLARWCLILAVSAGSICLADSITTDPTPADASQALEEIEQELFGYDPADGYSIAELDQLFTTDANAALYTNLLELITTLGGDDSMIEELFQPGAIFANDVDPLVVASALESSVESSSVPEPATMGLLGGALLLLCCYAFFRTGRINREVRRAETHPDGPIQRAD
jgi:hypothetical protein